MSDKKNLQFSKELIKRIYKISYKTSDTRGKNRQHTINEVVIETLKNTNLYEGCEFKTEARFKNLYWGTGFAVDVCIYKDGLPIEIVLIKAPASSIAKNKTNFLNSICGDITRLSKEAIEAREKGSDIKMTLVNFLPNKTPIFKGNEKVKNFEKNKSTFISICGAPYAFNIDEIYVTFDIDDLTTCNCKDDVRELFSDEKNPISNIEVLEGNYRR